MRAAIFAVVAALALAAGAAAGSGRASGAPDEARLELQESVVSLGTRFSRYQQEIAGIPVLGAEVVVTNGPGVNGDLVVDDTEEDIDAGTWPAVARSEALETAKAQAGVVELRSPPRASLAVLPGTKRDLLVWSVLLPSLDPLASFEVLVDAHTGGIVRVRDLLRRLTGSAMLFDPNPVERQGSRSGLADSGDADSPALTSLRTSMPLPRLFDSNECSSSPFTLRGQWAVATLPTSGSCGSSPDFTGVTRQDDRFEALMAYAQIDRVQAHIQSLGLTNVRASQQALNVNVSPPGQPDNDNSFFDPTTGEITLGPGGVDDGEDADVIVHEYGHAIQNAQVPGFGESQQGGAMGEGFGDYLAASISATYSPESGASADACIGEWDSSAFPSAPPCIRRADTDLTVAEVSAPPCSGEVHCAGQAWSGALWDIRAQLGGAVTDRLVIQSHFSLTPNADFHAGSQALLAADSAVNGGVNRPFIRGLLISRGLLDAERLDDTPTDAVPLAVPGSVGGALNAASDLHDVYRLTLGAGAGLLVNLTGVGDFDVRLYGPGTTSLQGGAIVASSATFGTSNESFSYVPPAAGDYFLDVAAASGSGAYTLAVARLDRDGDGRTDDVDNCPTASNPGQEDLDRDGIGDVCDRFPQDAANDADRDGFGANVDNCPAASNPGQEDLDRDGIGDVCDRFPQDRRNDADKDGLPAGRDNCPLAKNPKQADWDRDGRGDRCDRDAQVRLTSLVVRRSLVLIRGLLRPADLKLARVRALVQRQVCTDGRCRYRRWTSAGGARRIRSGRIELDVRLRQDGQYRVRLELRDAQYERAKSKFVLVSIGG